MGLKNPFKLEKLKITAYSKRKRGVGDKIDSFTAMFNPESIKQKYEIRYGKAQGIDSSGRELKYSRSDPSDLDLKLILDGSGVSEFGLVQLLSPASVPDRVKKFLDIAYHMNGDIHEPNFLVVSWGNLNFPCRLSYVDINYTQFDKDGSPSRAELNIKLFADEEVTKRQAKDNKTSPDLTHSRVIKNGDTLPLLSKSIYGSSEHYLTIAEFNQLDNFRDLTPGQTIYFPPLP